MRTTIALALTLLSYAHPLLAQDWAQTPGPGGNYIQSVAVTPANHIFVASKVLFRSTDDGRSWSPLPRFSRDSVVRVLSRESGIVYAILGDPSKSQSTQSLFRSVDDGQSWSKIHEQATWYRTLTILPGGELVTLLPYQGKKQVARSMDRGTTWKYSVPEVEAEWYDLFCDDIGIMYLWTTNGMFRSSDNGATWGKILNGLPRFEEYGGLHLESNGPGSIFFESGWMYRSTDNGRTWTQLAGEGGQLCKSADGALLTSFRNSIPRISTDDGATWKLITNAPQINRGAPIIADARQTNGFWAGVEGMMLDISSTGATSKVAFPNASVRTLATIGDTILAGGASRIDKSTNRGNSWTTVSYSPVSMMKLDSGQRLLVVSGANVQRNGSQLLNVQVGAITALEVAPNGYYYAASNAEGVFRSSDDGMTWDQMTSGLTDKVITALAVHQNGSVYAGASDGIFRSSNNGISWTKLTTNFSTGAGPVTTLAVNPMGEIIAGVRNGGAYRSQNNGQTWVDVGAGLGNRQINALLSTPIGEVVAATDSGLYTLAGAASSWKDHSSGTTYPRVLSLTQDEVGRVYAGLTATVS